MTSLFDIAKKVKLRPWIIPMTDSQKEMLKAKLDKLKGKKIRSKIKYRTDSEDEPAYYEGSGNTPFGYSQEGEDN